MDTLGLSQFKIPIGKIAPLIEWKDRQGQVFSYRHYPAWSENLIILFHGVGSDSRYLAVLASMIAEKGLAQVVTPDLRGHGSSFGVSDKIKANQLEVDLEELWVHLKQQHSLQQIVLAGHSMGGAFALRCASKRVIPGLRGVWAIVPHLPEKLHLHQEDWGRWIEVKDGQIQVQLPKAFQTGREKLSYSAEYLEAVKMDDELESMSPSSHCLVSIGGRDPLYKNQDLKKYLQQLKTIKLLYFEEANHFSIIMKKDVLESQLEALAEFFV